MASLSTGQILRIERAPSEALRAELFNWAAQHGREWQLGGPSEWSREELVKGVCRIRRGEEP